MAIITSKRIKNQIIVTCKQLHKLIKFNLVRDKAIYHFDNQHNICFKKIREFKSSILVKFSILEKTCKINSGMKAG